MRAMLYKSNDEFIGAIWYDRMEHYTNEDARHVFITNNRVSALFFDDVIEAIYPLAGSDIRVVLKW